MRLHRFIATVLFALSFGASVPLFTKNVEAQESQPRQLFTFPTLESGLRLPFALQETPEDRAEWRNLEEILKILPQKYFRKLTGKEVVDKIIQGLLEKLDPHTSYLPPDEFREMGTRIRGTFGGLGIKVTKKTEGTPGILIISPIDDTPAGRADIKAGDIITHIDGAPTAEMTLSEAVILMRGATETNIQLTIFRAGEENPLIVDLKREIIKITFVKSELKDGVGHLRISSFAELVPDQIKEAVKKIVEQNGSQKLTGWVLDLSNNPGGLLDIAVAVNNLFLDHSRYLTYLTENGELDSGSRVTISVESRGSIDPEYYVGPSRDILGGLPLVILVNRGTASASEIVARTLQIYGRATIVGAQTFGKGTIQTVISLHNGGALRTTSAQYLIGPSGCEHPVQGVGVMPDILLAYESETGNREEELSHSLTTSDVSRENCQYHYELPAGHREAAYDMLRAMGLDLEGNYPVEQ